MLRNVFHEADDIEGRAAVARGPVFEQDYFTADELDWIAGCGERDTWVTSLWSAKEAVIDVAKGFSQDGTQALGAGQMKSVAPISLTTIDMPIAQKGSARPARKKSPAVLIYRP